MICKCVHVYLNLITLYYTGAYYVVNISYSELCGSWLTA